MLRWGSPQGARKHTVPRALAGVIKKRKMGLGGGEGGWEENIKKENHGIAYKSGGHRVGGELEQGWK